MHSWEEINSERKDLIIVYTEPSVIVPLPSYAVNAKVEPKSDPSDPVRIRRWVSLPRAHLGAGLRVSNNK